MTHLTKEQIKEKAREALVTPWDHYNDCEGTERYLKEKDVDTLIDQVWEAAQEEEREESNARYIADLYRIRGHFMMPDPLLEPGKLEIPTNYTIITTMISHLCDKYDVTYEEIKQALTTPLTDKE